ncbi:MAG: hypothetical protein QOI20_629 [Acidimicrobiaceae bacterium]|jgi:hypothetical protein|nr:hypothetical protein [Acidimicrobiaceae bacterium]
MPEHTTNGVPSKALRDHVATLADEGVDLLRRVVAFAAEARGVGADFDREVEGASLTEEQYQAAAALAGFGLLHSAAEQMAVALMEAVGFDEALDDEPRAA